MSDTQQGPDWWQASDGKWYPPQQATGAGGVAAPAATQVGQATIHVQATFFPLFWIFYLLKPKAAIDGSEVAIAWKTPTSIPVAAGAHRVEVWCPYFFFKDMGRNGTDVNLAPGQSATVVWSSPWLIFLKGAIKVS